MGAHLPSLGPRPLLPATAALALALAGCGGAATSSTTSRTTVGASKTAIPVAQTSQRPKQPPRPSYPRLLRAALGSSSTALVPAVSWRGRTPVWIGRSPSGVALLSFDQHLVEVRLHSGSVDAGGSGWRFGPAVVGGERRRLVAAFNGGFRFSTGAGGFESYGRVGAPVGNGLASIVTYVNGRTDIGRWHDGVPAPGVAVASVRQNLTLLIDRGTAASTSVASRVGTPRSEGSSIPLARRSESPPTGDSCGRAVST
jgi:hypothetical protein